MKNFLYLIAGMVTSVRNILDDKLNSLVAFSKYSLSVLSINLLGAYFIYVVAAIAIETAIWGESFSHFLDNIVTFVFGLIWAFSVHRLAARAEAEDLLRTRAVGTLIKNFEKMVAAITVPQDKDTIITNLRENIQYAEDHNLVRLRDSQGNYHVVTGAMLDVDGSIILTE